MPTKCKVRFCTGGLKPKNKLELYCSNVVDNFMSNEIILGWDKKLKKWHIMVPIWTGDMLSALCEKDNKPSYRFVDYNPNFNSGQYLLYSRNIFPKGTNLENISQKLKYNNICKSCIKKEVSNIKEFKQWLIIQKLKYL